MGASVSDIQRQVKKRKQLNEHAFEYPTAQAPAKKRHPSLRINDGGILAHHGDTVSNPVSLPLTLRVILGYSMVLIICIALTCL